MVDSVQAEAHGRVNLIGEHTDYHEGFVLPTPIPQRTRVTLTRRADRQVRVSSRTMGGDPQTFTIGHETRGRGWLDYIQGVTVACRQWELLPGFDLQIESDVPVGAGVSSSAALTVSLLRGLRALLALEIDDIEVARLARAAETDFVGAPVGVMDQIAASLGRLGEALFLDTRSLAVERVPIPATIALGVIDSGIPHHHADGGYRLRRQESFAAAAALGVAMLREAMDVSESALEALPDTLARRARHIISENRRVLAAVTALQSGDGAALGALFAASHASMRDDFNITTPEIDLLVALAAAHEAVFGARMTGGGFGGAVVLLCEAGRAAEVTAAVCREYQRRTESTGVVLIPAEHPTAGS